jgi:1-hydroxycarotenoid 3,4-desaturase
MKRAVVVGAGVGGLAAAIRLARAGVQVTLLERAPMVGGKLRQVEVGGRQFDAGPSVLTMRFIFEELLGERFAEYLTLRPVDPLCRHFFPDGSVLDLHTDEARSHDAIRRFAGEKDARGYLDFRRHARKIYDIVRGPFMEQAIPPLFQFLSPRALLQMTQIDGMRTLDRALKEFFPDPRLRQLFGRYATYNGSSPYHAPATLAVIAHVENEFGVFSVEGGIYGLAEALERRARELGVEIATSAEVDEVLTEERAGGPCAVGVRLRSGGESRADVVVANCDVAHLYERLLSRAGAADRLGKRHGESELSLSAYVWLLLSERSPLDLIHHNVFFSRDYRAEFEELVTRRRPPEDPTVYLNAQDRVAGGATAAIDPERIFLLSNAPPRDSKGAVIDWRTEAPRCRARIVRVLRGHGWTPKVIAEGEETPADFEAAFPGSRGALYGLASNDKMAAFRRPENQVKGIARLYAVGGSAHPGAGLPMVALSARIATEMALSEIAKER